jgi:hypothetical protein
VGQISSVDARPGAEMGRSVGDEVLEADRRWGFISDQEFSKALSGSALSRHARARGCGWGAAGGGLGGAGGI